MQNSGVMDQSMYDEINLINMKSRIESIEKMHSDMKPYFYFTIGVSSFVVGFTIGYIGYNTVTYLLKK